MHAQRRERTTPAILTGVAASWAENHSAAEQTSREHVFIGGP